MQNVTTDINYMKSELLFWSKSKTKPLTENQREAAYLIYPMMTENVYYSCLVRDIMYASSPLDEKHLFMRTVHSYYEWPPDCSTFWSSAYKWNKLISIEFFGNWHSKKTSLNGRINRSFSLHYMTLNYAMCRGYLILCYRFQYGVRCVFLNIIRLGKYSRPSVSWYEKIILRYLGC